MVFVYWHKIVSVITPIIPLHIAPSHKHNWEISNRVKNFMIVKKYAMPK